MRRFRRVWLLSAKYPTTAVTKAPPGVSTVMYILDVRPSIRIGARHEPDAVSGSMFRRFAQPKNLGVDVTVIQTPLILFCMENH